MKHVPGHDELRHAAGAAPSRSSLRGALTLIGIGIVVTFGVGVLAFPTCACATPEMAALAFTKTAVRDLMTLQDMHRADAGAYTDDVLALGVAIPDGVTFHVQATETWWAGIARQNRFEGEIGCAAFMGEVRTRPSTPGGKVPAVEGEIVCDPIGRLKD